jgi:acyl carrier protein phosphodiesterase
LKLFNQNETPFTLIMNYLAHAFLADTSEEFLIGSIIADFVKGAVPKRYSNEVTQGIVFHRKVDVFTDTHQMTVESKHFISGRQRRYAGIVLDICCDHFLSRHWSTYADTELVDFISRVYEVLQKHAPILPDSFQSVLPRMLHQNWLACYRSLRGVEKTLERISRRIARNIHLNEAMQDIQNNYRNLERNFLIFFPDLVQFTNAYLGVAK